MLHRYYAIEIGANANRRVCVCVSYKSANKAQPVINPGLNTSECKGIPVFVKHRTAKVTLMRRVCSSVCHATRAFMNICL